MIAIGRRVYGLGVAALGAVEVAFGGFSPDWLPVSPRTPAYHVLLYASAGLLVVAGLAINYFRAAALSALALAIFLAAWIPILLLPRTLVTPTEWVGWQSVAESTAMALGGVLAYSQVSGLGERGAGALFRVARRMFGGCLIVFGVSHFVYGALTASLVPAWLPLSRLFWAYATGAAQIAAGLAMMSGIGARLAAILLTGMYVIFGLLVHIPSILAKPSSLDNWTENAINLVLVGAAWTLADSLEETRR